ncbi:MAG: ribonuclease III [Acidimicrobiia bacterium]
MAADARQETHRPTLVGRDRLLAALGYEPADESLLAQAFAHRSWCAEHPEYQSNERLEFLGDSVLGFVVADHVYRAEAGLDEGALTDVRKAVVNSVCLAEVALELGLGDHLRLGKGEEQSGGREKPSILADAMEAVLGAVYLDGGLDEVRRLVVELLGDRIDAVVAAGGGDQDHKSRLQERLATVTSQTASYSFDATGPDHAREFTVTVTVGDHQLGVGYGRSKKQAEQQAARAALELLGDDGAGYPGAHDAVGGTTDG